MEKYILVACAMKREAQIILDELNFVEEVDIKGFKFYKGTFENKNLIIGISNPGLINMSSMISIAVMEFDIECIINYGMAGAYDLDTHKHDIIVGSECLNVNSYITGKLDEGIDINQWNLITFTDGGEDKLVVYSADMKLLYSCNKLGYDRSNIIFGRIGSSDVWDREYDKMKMLQDKYSVDCKDMEAVAIYQLAHKFEIPCISIKGISDNEFLGEIYDDSVLEYLKDYLVKYISMLEI